MLRARGNEYGAITGRPRRCGWADAVVLRYAVRINGIDTIALTKLDVLDTCETVKICTGYRYRGDMLTDFPGGGAACGTRPSPCTRRCRAGMTLHRTGCQELRRRCPPRRGEYLERLSELIGVPFCADLDRARSATRPSWSTTRLLARWFPALRGMLPAH